MKKKVPDKKPGNPQILLRLPDGLREKLEADAQRFECTVQSMLLWIAGQHYGLDVPEPARGRPKK